MEVGVVVRRTSAEAYHALIDSGALSRKRALVYDTLFRKGPLTEAGVHSVLGGDRVSVSPRFAELQLMGLIEEVGTAINQHSGNTVILWDVTDRVVPLSLTRPKHVSRKEMEARIAELEAEASQHESIDVTEVAKMLEQSIMEVRWPCTLDDLDKAIEFVRERLVHAYAIRGVPESNLKSIPTTEIVE